MDQGINNEEQNEVFEGTNQDYGEDENYYGEENGEIQQNYYDDEYQIYDLMIKRTSSCPNKQYQISQLTSKIMEETQKLNESISLGMDWSLLYYYACGWRNDLCQTLFLSVDEKTKVPLQKHKQIINYTDKYVNQQGQRGIGECDVCGEGDKLILKNICGHEFCQDCWKYHIAYRFQTEFRDPFPPCMSEDCLIRISYTLFLALFKNNPDIEKKFSEVLCRNYSTYNKSVKICKGKPGISCNKCFAIDKMFDVIQCITCGNFVCPRCGEKNHGPSQCFQINNWKKLTQQSTQFVQFLNYRICPNCEQAVERENGCNSMKCPCKQQFCYVCGQKWLPNHSAHGDTTCYRYKQITALNEQKQKKKGNQKQYFQKIQDRVSKLDSINNQFSRIDQIKKALPQYEKMFLQIQSYNFYSSEFYCLKQFCSFVQKILCFIWGQTLSLHFKADPSREFFLKMVQKNKDKIMDFLFEVVQKTYKSLEKRHELNKQQQDQLSKFADKYRKQVKQIQQTKSTLTKLLESIENLT